MNKDFIKDHPGLLLTGYILIWYILATLIDLFFLANTKFSKLIVLKEAYLGMKPIGLPLPESGMLLFIIGTILIIQIYLLFEKKGGPLREKPSFISALGFSILILVSIFPLLVLGEIAYLIVVKKLCDSVSWLKWLESVLDLFSFKAKIQASFVTNPMTIEMTLGSFLGLYIGLPKVREKLKI